MSIISENDLVLSLPGHDGKSQGTNMIFSVCTKNVCKNSGDFQVGSTCYRFLGSAKQTDDNTVCKKQGGTIANLGNGSAALKAVAAKAWAHPGWNGAGGTYEFHKIYCTLK